MEGTSGDPHQTIRQAGMGPDCKGLLVSPRGWCLKGPGPLAPESAAVRGRGQGVKGDGSALSPLTHAHPDWLLTSHRCVCGAQVLA